MSEGYADEVGIVANCAGLERRLCAAGKHMLMLSSSQFDPRNGVRQESWQRIGGESPPRGRSSQPPRPRVMHEVLLARAAVKRSQGRPRAKY